MDYPITFTIQTPAELYAFLQQNHGEISQTTIEKVYNLGRTGFVEYSLFLLTKHHAVNLFFNNDLSIDVYPREVAYSKNSLNELDAENGVSIISVRASRL